MKKLTLLLTLLFSTQTFATTEDDFIDFGIDLELPISINGYFLTDRAVTKEYVITDAELTNQKLEHIIKASNKSIPAAEVSAIASNVLKVSKCFDIDPWFLMSLIHKESSFDREAESPTKAAGLTQFTRIGLEEVNDQLGIRGPDHAKASVTQYLNNQVYGCVNNGWTHLWDRVKHRDANSPLFYSQIKEVLKDDIEAAVTYGAILLKVYLAYADSRNIRNNTNLDDYEIYYQALMLYNGEAGNAKVQYAKNIFKFVMKHYPTKLNYSKIRL